MVISLLLQPAGNADPAAIVSGSACNSCHRMGVSNTTGTGIGAARDFGIRATAMSDTDSRKMRATISCVMFEPNASSAQR
jgi:hypothetical protein